MTSSRAYVPLEDLADPGLLPLGDLLDDVLQHIWIASPEYDPVNNEGVVGILIDEEIAAKLPGISAVQVVLGSGTGFDFEIRARFEPTLYIGIEVPVTLRIDAEILRPLKPGTDEPDLSRATIDVALGSVAVGYDTSGALSFEIPGGISVPRCMIGSTGVIVSIGSLRWITPQSDRTTAPTIPNTIPANATGVYLSNVTVEIPSLPIPAGTLTLDYAFIGTGGFSAKLDWSAPTLKWNGSDFESGLHGDLFGFKGGLSKVTIAFAQSALSECDVQGNIFVPYIDRVIGLSLGIDGQGGVTAVASTPTCTFTKPTDAATTAPSGYIIAADTAAFTLDISRIEFHAATDAPASLSFTGRAKLKVAAFDLPAVEFKGLRIDTQGHVAVDGGWLDVDTAKSTALKGFPFQITKVGFGAESSRRRWIGLNGALKLAEGLPIGASVEGLRVIWDLDHGISFTLEGIGLALRVPGAFSFAGKVSFFSNTEATGFRGTVQLKLESIGLEIDAALMVGRANDGTSFFYFYLDIELPAGIPLFTTGAALYGFSGLLATNLKPARSDGENWYYGYYRRPPIGVTDPTKWTLQRGGFALGLGTTVGSLPDTGFAFSAKVFFLLVLPGPQLLLQGKGDFIKKKPASKDPAMQGSFEALLVLDIPAKLFQANLAAAFGIPALVDVSGGVDVAFSWDSNPPDDIWHVYLGEKSPAERRIHATLFKILKGDSWLMINRAHQWPPGLTDRKGDFEIGGSIGVDFKFDFTVAKAWLNASLSGEAAITWDPQQFTGFAELKGSAGISALGLSVSATLDATVTLEAPNPWYLTMDIEVGIKIDLLFVKWQFNAKLPLEFGDKTQPFPEPVTGLTSLSVDYAVGDEAGDLANAIVAPDARPLVLFKRPVRDLARFGSPGRDDVPEEDLGLRKISYQLRHIVLLANGGSRLVGAAGQVTIAGTSATFGGLGGAGASLPNLAGTQLTLFQAGGADQGPFTVSAGSGATATIAGTAPAAGDYSYRLSARQAQTTVQITSVGTVASGSATLSVVGTVASPDDYKGGSLTVGAASWLVLEATGTTVRIRVDATTPSPGAATLVGPTPASIAGQWFPAGSPPTNADSSTRLQLWAKTPYAFFRHNEQSLMTGSDAFDPAYACGPEAIETPTCTTFDDVATGSLSGSFTTASVHGSASGSVWVAATTGGGKTIALGAAGTGGNSGTVVFQFDEPVDAVWVTAESIEGGTVKAWQGGTLIGQDSIGVKPAKLEYTGGVDKVEVTGSRTLVRQLCWLPDWTCVHFDAASFTQGQTGDVSYAGVTLSSDGAMNVAIDTLEVDPPAPPPVTVTLLGPGTGGRVTPLGQSVRTVQNVGATTDSAGTGQISSSSEALTAETEPSPGFAPFGQSSPLSLGVGGLVEAVPVTIRGLGPVTLVPHFTPIPIPGTNPLGVGGRLGTAFTLPRNVATLGQFQDQFTATIRPGLNQGGIGRVWVQGSKAAVATLTVLFPRPVTRVRVRLASGADVFALAGQTQVARGSGSTGDTVSLYADPNGGAHLGWLDRVTIIGPSQVRITEVCTDAGDFGWQRYEQWKWSQGVQRSVESLYSADPVLPPGDYDLRVHTAAVVTGTSPNETYEIAHAPFTVGSPPGFPVAAANATLPGVYPYGGPHTELSTFVARTLPPAGAPLWYRAYDTAVGFDQSYITRLYLEAGKELLVFVSNAAGVDIRSGTRHVWASGDASFDTWTDLYVRTLNGDGTDPCATVSVDKVARPEQVTAGGGEPLEPSRLHASELRTAGATPTVVHRFEFTTSRYVSFRHHLAAFDGRCRRLTPDASATASSTPPSDRATTQATSLATIATALTAATSATALASTGTPSQATLDAAAAALVTLTQARSSAATQGTTGFDAIWTACFGSQNPAGLPDALRLSVVRASTAGAGTNVLFLESPEPIAWERTTLSAAKASSVPQRKITTTIGNDFGRPDAGFEVQYGGLRWLPAVELWVVDGAVRARAAEPLNVTLYPEQASVIDIKIRIDAGGSATISTVPAQTGGAIVRGPSSAPTIVTLTAPAGSLLASVTVSGTGVGIEACTITMPFVPVPPIGQLRIAAITLPTTSQPLDHEITLLAMDSTALDGYTVRWLDALSPSVSQLYANVSSVTLRAGQRLRLVPSRATAPAVDDALVQAGGPGVTPPATGAVYQLMDPDGRVVHECAAMPVTPPSGSTLVAFPSHDGARAFLVPPTAAPAIAAGFWTVQMTLAGDAGFDLETWSIGGTAVQEEGKVRFLIL